MSGAGESDGITGVSFPSITEWAGSRSTWFTLAALPFHVVKRSSGAPISTQKTLQKIPGKHIHAMDHTTVLYALVSLLVLLIFSVSSFN